MSTLLAAAFAAGMISTVNPCGFAMLPAYLGLFLGDDPGSRRSVLAVAASVSVGFVAVFLVVGALVVAGIRAVIAWIPWMTLLIGGAFVVAGVALIAGHSLLPALRLGRGGSRDRTLAGMVGFGASYGIASLSCTLPIFLSLTAGAVAGSGPGQGLLTFAAYGLGMTLSVTTITAVIGLGRDRIVARIRPIAARIHAIAGWVLAAAGLFIIWYWVTVLSSGAAALGGNPIVGWIERTSATVGGIVARHPLAVALGGIVVVALGVAATNAARSTDREPEDGRVSAGEPAHRG